MSKRRKAFIGSRKLGKKWPCPNCSTLLDGATSVLLDKNQRGLDLKGKLTMCLYCGALVAFADSAGRLRVTTAEERQRAERLDPVLKKLLEDWRRDKVPNYAKKTYGGFN